MAVSVQYLVLGGGGGGGRDAGGGGGGGGMVTGTDSVNPGQYAVVVGSGGAEGGNKGNNSSWNGHTGEGGGGGNGGDGGCGGGRGWNDAAVGVGSQGYNGGSRINADPHWGGGGGGGMGAVGGDATYGLDIIYGGNGGNGLASSITGSSVTYGGGGGGGSQDSDPPPDPVGGNGGTGGGGAGGGNAGTGTNGTDYLGGGGGGSGNGSAAAGRGGKGVVILRYLTADAPNATGGSAATDGDYTVRTFQSDGTFEIPSGSTSSSLSASSSTSPSTSVSPSRSNSASTSPSVSSSTSDSSSASGSPAPGEYRYWRLLCLGNTYAGNYIRLGDLEFHTSIGGADVCTGGTAIGSTQYAGQPYSYAFDADPDTEWVGSTSGAQMDWIGYDFGAGNWKEIVEVKITMSAPNYASWGNFDLQGSQDGTTWVTVKHFRDQTAFTAGGQNRTYSTASVNYDAAPHVLGVATYAPYAVTANSNSASYDPYHAFDKNWSASYWLPSSGATGWIKIDFGAGNTEPVSHYSVQANLWASETNRAPKDWTFQGSNDNTNWTTLDTQTNQTGWSALETRQFKLASVTAYRYFKIDVTANNGDAILSIGELYLNVGEVPSTSPSLSNSTSSSRSASTSNSASISPSASTSPSRSNSTSSSRSSSTSNSKSGSASTSPSVSNSRSNSASVSPSLSQSRSPSRSSSTSNSSSKSPSVSSSTSNSVSSSTSNSKSGSTSTSPSVSNSRSESSSKSPSTSNSTSTSSSGSLSASATKESGWFEVGHNQIFGNLSGDPTQGTVFGQRVSVSDASGGWLRSAHLWCRNTDGSTSAVVKLGLYAESPYGTRPGGLLGSATLTIPPNSPAGWYDVAVEGYVPKSVQLWTAILVASGPATGFGYGYQVGSGDVQLYYGELTELDNPWSFSGGIQNANQVSLVFAYENTGVSPSESFSSSVSESASKSPSVSNSRSSSRSSSTSASSSVSDSVSESTSDSSSISPSVSASASAPPGSSSPSTSSSLSESSSGSLSESASGSTSSSRSESTSSSLSESTSNSASSSTSNSTSNSLSESASSSRSESSSTSPSISNSLSESSSESSSGSASESASSSTSNSLSESSSISPSVSNSTSESSSGSMSFSAEDFQRSVPVADIDAGAWTNELDQTTDLWRSIGEAYPRDNTFIKSELAPADSVVKFRLSPLYTPDVGPKILRIRGRWRT